MNYVTIFERMSIAKGKQEGLLKGISLGLKLKFGSPGQDLLPDITAIQDVNILEEILEAIDTVNTLEELRQIYQNAG